MTPHDPKIVEAMARAICICDGECFETRHGMMHGPCEAQPIDATAALTALCALRPDVAAVLRGEAVVVPREATDAMALAALNRSPEPRQPASPVWQLYADIYRAMTAASPYAKEPPHGK